MPLDLLNEQSSADTGEENDDVDAADDQPIRKVDGGLIVADGDFAHRGADEGNTAELGNHALDVFGAATLESGDFQAFE